MNKFEQIKSIFYSGGTPFEGNYESINEITFLVDNGYLKMNDFPISYKNEYLNLFKEHSLLNKESRYDAAGGGDAHLALKILGRKYLKNKRNLDAKYEQPFYGYFPDVISVDKSIIIECGVTANPEKMFTYFQHGNIKELIQIPYPMVEDDKEIMAYSFTPSKNIKDFLSFLQSEKNKDIKNILNRRRTTE
jgi:hypothetical protein